MERTEYMRLKGELTHASEQRQTVSTQARARHGELQGFINKLLSSKLSDTSAQQAHGLIDDLLRLQKQEAYWLAQEKLFRDQVANEAPPAD